MGKLHEYNQAVEKNDTDDFSIRVPLTMIQLTKKNGCVLPLSFDWENRDEGAVHVKVDRVVSITPAAERKNGAVGDRYECEVEGRREYLYYTKLQPRKWFLIQKVSETEYNNYYKLPGK